MSSVTTMLRLLAHPSSRRRLWLERGVEPLHVNLVSAWVALFGSTRDKILYDLVPLQSYAYGIEKATAIALKYGVRGITLLEFGVAAGRGLLNMCKISETLARETGMQYRIVGFDGGSGMPVARDYRDHPDLYAPGDFPMFDREKLQLALPANASLILGDVAETTPKFFAELNPEFPIGFVSIDVDYYWSSIEAMQIFKSAPEHYLPYCPVYFDDIMDEEHNSWCGELAAIREFNDEMEMRKIERSAAIRKLRPLKHAWWIDQMFFMHVLDHPVRQHGFKPAQMRSIGNPYL